MVAPIPIFSRKLTGKTRLRCTWRKRLLLQVEVECTQILLWMALGLKDPPEPLRVHYEWRDATADDALQQVLAEPQNVELSERQRPAR